MPYEIRLEIEDHELKDFERDLHDLPKEIVRQGEAVVKKGALNIKKGWRRRWEGHPHIKHLPRAIGFDMDTTPERIHAEIGVDKHMPQGPLGHIIEFGVPGHNLPFPAGAFALDEEAPRFVKAVGDLGVKVLEQKVKRASAG